MTRCPALVLVCGTLLPVYVSFLGMEASNWKITVDSDFANYLSAATVMKRELTAFGYAKAAAKEKHVPPKVASGRRRLAGKSAYRVYKIGGGGLDIFYHAKDSEKGIFTK